MLECHEVHKAYGSGPGASVALRGISFRAEPGEVVGVVGPNRAGTTTLLRLIAGDLPLSSGSITVEGNLAGSTTARRQVGFAADPAVAPPELSGVEWLRYLASHRARSGTERERLLNWAVGVGEVAEFAGRRIAQLSRGMAQRLALAAAALAGTRVVLLDETLNGLDPILQRRLGLQVARLAAEGRVVVIASHDLGTVERVATRVLILSHGRLYADVSMAEVVSDRVAEVALRDAGSAALHRVLGRYKGAERTPQGIAVPLRNGLSVAAVLAACREEGLDAVGSRVRYRGVEKILLRGVAHEEASP